MNKVIFVLRIVFFFLQFNYIYSYPEIKNFSNKDPIFSDLRAKISKYNKRENVPLFIYSYKVKKNDTFFKIANKVNGWQASIATVNLLDSPFLSTGQEILIPSKKGLSYLIIRNIDLIIYFSYKRLNKGREDKG